jgi:hypothetical protein
MSSSAQRPPLNALRAFEAAPGTWEDGVPIHAHFGVEESPGLAATTKPGGALSEPISRSSVAAGTVDTQARIGKRRQLDQRNAMI